MTEQTPSPLKSSKLVLYLSLTLNVSLTLVSLVSAAQTKIKWKSYLLDLAIFYRTEVTQPISRLIQPALDYLDLSLIAGWLPIYIPVASAFFVGFLGALYSTQRIMPIDIIKSLVKIACESFPFGAGLALMMAIAGSIITTVIFLFGPFSIIAAPLAFAGIVSAYAFALSLLCLVIVIAREIVWMTLKCIATFSICAFWAVKLDPALEKYAIPEVRVLPSLAMKSIRHVYVGATQWPRELLQRMAANQDVRKQLDLLVHAVKIQYSAAVLVGMLFLLIFALNASLEAA